MAKTMDPRMHSAEHILNQTMQRMFHSGRCFSAHIEKKKSKCDYHFDRELNEAEEREIEQRVNGIIREDMSISEFFITKEEARKRYNLERLPAGAGEKIRIIAIGDYDTCACIGPHVRSTKEIGRFRLSSSTYDGSTLRIRYKLERPSE
jgi:Ser-tRNA(Ala) deacylase AlaX